MKKAKSNLDKVLINNSDEEEDDRNVDTPPTVLNSANEQSRKYNLLAAVKNFFKNHTSGNNLSKTQLNGVENHTLVKEENVKNNSSIFYDFPTPNDGIESNGARPDRSIEQTNGHVPAERSTKETNGQRIVNERISNINGKDATHQDAFSENTTDSSLHLPLQGCGESEINNHEYENLEPRENFKAQENDPETGMGKQLLQSEDEIPRTTIRNNREGNRCLSTNQQHLESFSRNPIQRSFSADSLDARYYVNVKPRFSVIKFIQDNVRTLSLSNLHSGGAVILNTEDTNVEFLEFRSDTEPIIINTETHKRLSNIKLMSGGSVVFEEFSDGFMLPNLYNENPLVFEELPDGLEIPETSNFELPTTTRPILARSCSGGGLIGDTPTATSLPELFPVKKTPPRRSLQRPLSGGGLVEPKEGQDTIFLDILSQSLRFDVGQATSESSEETNQETNQDTRNVL